MAIGNVKEFAHLTDEQVEDLGRRFDAIRSSIEADLGSRDARYIRNLIRVQRRLVVAARVTLFASAFPPAWVAGTGLLAVAKILENMEIGHNVMHGQWDWMNDPEIHSGTWEWDTTCPAEGWKHSHNYVHHTFTNVLGKDNDVGYGILRVRPEQPWHPFNLGQPVYNALLALLFEWGVALHDLDIEAIRKRRKDPAETRRQLKVIWRKVRRQVGKDYLVFPLLSGPAFASTVTANATANLIRNLWSYMIIFCGHFPDGAEVFLEEELEGEQRPQWYLRQLLGAANFEGGRLLHVMSGSLGYQIEHHLFPDLPSNRYPEIAAQVRELCRTYRLPYTIGPLHRQYGQTLRTLLKLSLPGSSSQRRRRGEGRRAPRATIEELRRYDGPMAPQAAVS
ncbi:fatty acid desaturase [Acidiferrimicrobium sp. IK]|uniref:fatty acid desaturase family protein n=1 Tax=Acidiferrimicrobium sp. IK TaxID=2871700 RepID=UPI0021CB2A8D|nr:fatty acid desaturase [Acidiferrimicrobium sp. IK]MCU4184447.1 fatty acid desaturase [Acidiferrimicrobium sp. IK]